MFVVVDSCEFLKLEKYSNGLSSVFFSTFSLLTSSVDTPTDNWRIRIHTPEASRILAVSETEEGIMKKWSFLMNLNVELGAIDSIEDKVKYFLDKVTSLAQIQEGGGEEEELILKFKKKFPELENEKFIKCINNCWWWCSGRVMPFEGRLFLTEKSMVFSEWNNNFEKIIPIAKISHFSKDPSGYLQESIMIVVRNEELKSKDSITTKKPIKSNKIQTNNNNNNNTNTITLNNNINNNSDNNNPQVVEITEEKYWVSTDNNDVLYDTIDSIWKDLIYQWQLKLEPGKSLVVDIILLYHYYIILYDYYIIFRLELYSERRERQEGGFSSIID
jgi:hypothetical protein